MSDALTPDDVARIEELAEKATPGPWEIDAIESGEHGLFIEEESTELGVGGRQVAGWLTAPNAEFIAAARTAVPALVAGVRSRDERIAELEAVIAEIESARTVARGAQNDMLIGRPDMDALEEIALQDRLIDAAISTYRAGVDQ